LLYLSKFLSYYYIALINRKKMHEYIIPPIVAYILFVIDKKDGTKTGNKKTEGLKNLEGFFYVIALSCIC
jgi:hypothetical protein